MLKALMLRKEIETKRAALAEIQTRADELVKREKDLEIAIEEASTEEERSVVKEAVEFFESDKAALDEEKTKVEGEIAALEEELAACETEPTATPAPAPAPAADPQERNRKEITIMEKRYSQMTRSERAQLVEAQEVRTFLEKVRNSISEKRSLSNAGLLIPTVLVDMLRPEVAERSKLVGKVNTQPVKGKARATVMADIPEAVWTEMCANLNEMNLVFNGVEVDAYKVGGFIPVCNAVLEDSDIDLMDAVMYALAAGIALALDKAIVYGTGTKMPLGIVTRLAQTSQPSGYPATMRAWVDLHTTHVITGTSSLEGAALFKEIIAQLGVVSNPYHRRPAMWLMNEKTKVALMAEALNFNANGALVAGINDQMPVVGGEIITLEFIPDNNIVVGYGEGYFLAERDDVTIAYSEHVRFTADQTVFKSSARYDGLPVIAEAFAVYGLNGTAPTTSGITFAQDTANFQ